MIQIAKSKAVSQGKNNIQFMEGNAFGLSFDKEHFDYVLMANVLHIILEPEKALKEVRRILKKDGIFFAPTFTQAGIKRSWLFDKVVGLLGFKAFSSWSPETYEMFLKNNGFEVIDSKVVEMLFPCDIVVCRKKE